MLKVDHLFKSYKTGRITYEVLKDVCFEVKEREFVAVMGASGSGKTTMLNCISCFHPYDKGEITLNGICLSRLSEEDIARVRNEQLGFVFQDFMLLDGLTVFENVCVPKVIRGEDYKLTICPLAFPACSATGPSIRTRWPSPSATGCAGTGSLSVRA